MPHSLPSKPEPLATFTCFYKRATLGRDGGADLLLYLPPDMKHEAFHLSDNDGMALNVTVWASDMPEADGLGDLAKALGLDL